jgi:hypothetical protein
MKWLLLKRYLFDLLFIWLYNENVGYKSCYGIVVWHKLPNFQVLFSIHQETEKSTKLAQHWPCNIVPTPGYLNVVVGTLSPTKGIQAKQWTPIFICGANTIAGYDRVCGKCFPWWLTQRRLLNWWLYWKIIKSNYYCYLQSMQRNNMVTT